LLSIRPVPASKRLSLRQGNHSARPKAILATGRFSDTSIWIEGRRRWVWLKGCVRARADIDALVRLVRGIDDVEAVVNELVVKRR
jgi:osmotically-inducible protein OsmY